MTPCLNRYRKAAASRLKNEAGLSLVEIMLATAMATFLIGAVVLFFRSVFASYASMEAQNVLKSGVNNALNKISVNMTGNKRLFQQTDDPDFLAHLLLSADLPPVLAGSRLPIINPNGSLTPTAKTFVSADVGNSLFFVSFASFKDVSVAPSTFRIDLYQFNYYFLAADASGSLGGSPKRQLWEWHSVLYADYNEIMAVADVTQRSNLCSALYNGGKGILYAFDTSAATLKASPPNQPNPAFYKLTGLFSPNEVTKIGVHDIPQASAGKMTKLLTGMIGGGYHYAVSPNTADKGGSFAGTMTVPKFVSAADPHPADFPSGFEVEVTGPNSNRQYLLRLVLVAEGSFGGGLSIVSNESTTIGTARDLW